MTDDIKALRDAMPGTLNGSFLAFQNACHPERIARLLDALEAAQKDAARKHLAALSVAAGQIEAGNHSAALKVLLAAIKAMKGTE